MPQVSRAGRSDENDPFETRQESEAHFAVVDRHTHPDHPSHLDLRRAPLNGRAYPIHRA